MQTIPPPAQYTFVPFREERLQENGGRLLEGVVHACARSVATLGATRTSLHIVKGKEIQDSLGRTRFKPLFKNTRCETFKMPSIHCASCGTIMERVGILCTSCKSLPVRLCTGPPLVDFAWEGSGKSAEIGKEDEEAMKQADDVFYFAEDGIRYGKTLSHLCELSIHRGPTQYTEYPNVPLVQMELHKELHFQYTIILDKEKGDMLESVSNLIFKRVQVQALQWLLAVDLLLTEHQNNGVFVNFHEDDQRRIDRTCEELAFLIASHVSIQDDDAMHNRLCPKCLEKKALCEFVRCSSTAMDHLTQDKNALKRLLHVIMAHPENTSIRSLSSEFTDFLFERCPPELLAVLPNTICYYDVPCSVFANFIIDALHKLENWNAPSESSVKFPSTVTPQNHMLPGCKVLPFMEWCHTDVFWVVRRWSHSTRTGLDASGVRIVRLISTVWGMHAAGAFKPGVIHAKTLYTISEAYAGRAAAVREWAVQVLQPTLLRANLVDAKSMICNAAPEVEDEIDDCVSSFSNLALDEIITLTSPASSMYVKNYWRIADLAASMMSVRLPQQFYRDFVRVILPMAVAHLGEKRMRRGMSVSMRSNWIADILFNEPSILFITNAAKSGCQLPPTVFIPSSTFTTVNGKKTMRWLSEQPRKFVRKSRIGKDRSKGFEIIVKDLLSLMFPTSSLDKAVTNGQ